MNDFPYDNSVGERSQFDNITYTTLTERFLITMVLRSLLPSVLLERAALRDVTHAQTPYKVVKATPLNV